MVQVFPKKILLQWHITNHCNYRCSHCYQDRYNGTELDSKALIEILGQFKELLVQVRTRTGMGRVKGHVTVSGGEPFLHKEFPDLLEHLSANRDWTSFGILTNGSMIDASMAHRLKNLNISFVQISIEGSPSTHDRIRGEGSHEKAVNALKHLARAEVRTLISFTAHRGNFREFPEVVRLGRKLKVWRVWADRVIPQGSGNLLAADQLGPSETRKFFEIMLRSRNGGLAGMFSRTEVHMGRALQFLSGGGKPYSCEAGNGLITVMPDGSLYPCRRMPVAVGNVLDRPLQELYFESALFKSLRDRTRISNGCEQCFYSQLCRGGLRCLSYTVNGDPFTADPGCWRAVEASRQRCSMLPQEVCR